MNNENELNRYLRIAIYVGLFATLLIPLYVSGGLFFPFITGKNFAFRIIVEIVTVLALILWARDPEQKVKRSHITLSVAVFLIVITLASIFGEDPYRSFWSNYERMDGLITLLHMSAYFFVLVATLRTEKIWNWFLHASLAVAGLVSLYGLAQLAGLAHINQGGVRVDATFGNATYLAVYMLFHIFIASYYFFKSRESSELAKPDTSSFKQWVYAILALLYTFILYHTATRGVILGLIGGVLLALIITAIRSAGSARKWSVRIIISLIVLMGAFLGLRKASFVVHSPVLARFASISVNETTTQSRFVIWKMALQGAKEHPLLGWGPENFNIVFNKYFQPELWKQETWFDRAHNVFLDWLVAGGLLGLLSYLSIFAALIYLIWRKESGFSNAEQAILTGLFAAYFMQNLFVFDNLISYILFFVMLAFINFRARTNNPNFLPSVMWARFMERARAFAGGAYQSVVVSVLVIAMFFGVYFVNIKPIMANSIMINSLYPRNLSEANYANFQKVFGLNTFGSMEAREQLIFMLTEFRSQPGLDQTLFNKMLELGRTEMLKQLEQSGNDARHVLFMGSFLQAFGDNADALTYYNKALSLSPKKQLIMFSIESVYLATGRFDEALAIAKQAYDEDPAFDRARTQYAVAGIFKGDDKLVESLLTPRYGTALVADGDIISAYMTTKQYAKAVAIWKHQISASPSDPRGYLGLTGAYYMSHQDALAIQTLEEMAKLGGEAKTQADSLISQIKAGTIPR